jgi:DNA-directed RNA polymerase subunit RPC12/RpoP
MTLTFVCQACDDSFEADVNRLSEDSKGVKCPNCGKKLSASETDDLATTVDDLFTQVAALKKRFAISFEVDAEDLPPPYDAELKGAARGADEDEDDDELDEDDDELDEEVSGEDDDY